MSDLTTLIYGGGPFYSGGQPVMDDLRQSGFTTVVAWTIHVNAPSGDLVFNDTPLVQNGVYVGDPSWPSKLAGLKQGGGVDRLLFSVGSGGVSDFTHIQQLGTAQGGILWNNFQALKQAIPAIDGIDFDDEDLYDQDTVVSFALMLQQLGYGAVTFCPYTAITFWVDCLAAIDAQAPGFVAGFNLQCYSGGAGNDPGNWIDAIQQKMGPGFDAKGFVFPGLWCRHSLPQQHDCSQGMCPDTIQSTFAGWKSLGIQGGFIWLYDDIQACDGTKACSGATDAAAYNAAIVAGLTGT